MSEVKSQSFSESLEELEKVSGLNDCKFGVDLVQLYLQWNTTDIKRASPEQLKDAAYTMARYNLYLSDLQSHHFALADGAERLLNREVNAIAGNYKGYSLDERRAKALADPKNSSLLAIHDDLIENSMKSNRLKNLTYRIEDLIKKIENYLRR